MGSNRRTELTPRQRAWLEHLRAARQRGETVRSYASRRRLSESAMYQAAKDLRKRGVWPEFPRRKTSGQEKAFVRVSPAAGSPAATGTWRARLPNGVVLEGAGAPDRALLEALAGL